MEARDFSRVRLHDRYIIMVNNVEYDLLELVEKCLGSEVCIKSEHKYKRG